jgi:hypothetical protein
MSIQKTNLNKVKESQYVVEPLVSGAPVSVSAVQHEEKYEQHIKECESILADVLTPFAAFQQR